MKFTPVEDQEPLPEGITRRRLNGKQPRLEGLKPLQEHLKEMKLKRFEVEEEDEAEVTKTISLHEVYKHPDEWKESLKGELTLQYGKDV